MKKLEVTDMECRKYDLLTLGEVLLRLSPPANERMIRTSVFEQNIGGAELNVAAGVAQLGLRTGMIGKIPSNDIGRLARVKFTDRMCRMNIYFQMMKQMQDWGFIFMKVELLRENQELFMTEETPPGSK